MWSFSPNFVVISILVCKIFGIVLQGAWRLDCMLEWGFAAVQRKS